MAWLSLCFLCIGAAGCATSSASKPVETYEGNTANLRDLMPPRPAPVPGFGRMR